MHCQLPFTTSRFLLVLLAALVSAMAQAAGPTSEEELLGAMAGQVVPFTLSADGRTRLSVDAKHVLHRVALADPSQERHVELPFAVRALAASRTGQKVAVRSDPGCVGLVDFGAPGASTPPTLRWLDASFPEQRNEPARTPEPWSDQAPGSCAPREDERSGDLGWPTLALSVDGRLIATENQVVDTETQRLVASLRGGPMRLRFIDSGRRLLVQGIVTSSGYESVPDGLSEVNLAVWDLANGSLAGVQRHTMGALSPGALAVDLASDGAPVTWAVDEPDAPPGGHPIVLHRWDATACGGAAEHATVIAPMSRARLPGWMSIDQFVVDPMERWVATFRSVADEERLTSELVVQALADGRVLSRRKLAKQVGGALSTPDGTRLLALAWGPDVPATADGLYTPGEEVVEFPVDVTGLTAVATPAAAGSCGVDGAPAQARNVARPVHVLTPLWRQVFAPVAPRHLFTGDEPPRSAPACTSSDTFDISGSSLFFRRDGTLWVDRFSKLAQVDPASGKTLRTAPTPRIPQVCSTVSPAADGFFNIQGDTLTWRPLEAGTAPRRVIDQRPGLTAIELSTVGRAVRVGWVAQAGIVKASGEAPTEDFVVALHDASGRRVSQQAQSFGAYDYGGDAAAWLYGDSFMPACADAAGPIVDAVAWQVDVFESLRARACGASGAPARTLMWTDTDIVARPGTPRNFRPRPVAVAQDGAIAVMQDDLRLRVFDIEQRRELGQITWDSGPPHSVAVSAAQSVLVVLNVDMSGKDGAQAVATAYRFR